MNSSDRQTDGLVTGIAIIGMAGLFPKAPDLKSYWENIVNKVDCITDVPASHWAISDYYDPDPKAVDKTYCKRGGLLPEVDFGPAAYGTPPQVVAATDTSQLLGLHVAKSALEDAGYGQGSREFNREMTSVILGVGGGGMPLSLAYGFRACMPLVDSIPGSPVKGQTIVDLGEGKLMADASVSITDLSRYLGADLPEDGDYHSLGGFVVSQLGRVPEVGAKLVALGLEFVVREGDERRVTKVEITRIAPAESIAPRSSSRMTAA